MIEVTVDLNDEQKWVEIVVSAEHKTDLVANGHHKETLAAVDLVVHKLEQQVRKHKERLQDHRRTPAMGDVAGAAAPQDPTE
jgi:putative sigma-54 modulation protein